MTADRILVQPSDEIGERKSRAGILIPATANVEPPARVGRGRRGRARRCATSRRATGSCSRPTAGYEVEIRGDEYLILRERDVHAVASTRERGPDRPLPVSRTPVIDPAVGAAPRRPGRAGHRRHPRDRPGDRRGLRRGRRRRRACSPASPTSSTRPPPRSARSADPSSPSPDRRATRGRSTPRSPRCVDELGRLDILVNNAATNPRSAR